MASSETNFESRRHQELWWMCVVLNVVLMFPCSCMFWMAGMSDVGADEVRNARLMAVGFPTLGSMNLIMLFLAINSPRTLRARQILAVSVGLPSLAFAGFVLATVMDFPSDGSPIGIGTVCVMQLLVIFTILKFRVVRVSDRAICDSCGYERRGLPRDHPCPECGEKPRDSKDDPSSS